MAIAANLSAAEAGEPITIDVPAPGGVVTWEEIGVAIADAASLDGQVVRNLLPNGRLRLHSSKTLFVLAAVNLGTRGGIAPRVVDPPDGPAILRIELDRDWGRRQRARIERAMRERQSPGNASHGCRLSLPSNITDRIHGRELVLLTHGYNGDERSLRPLQLRLEQAGFVCGLFTYPNDGPLAAAAEQLSTQVRDLRTQVPGLRVALVTHSVGGLVARRVIEDAQLDPGCITRLIQVPPPNHGSNLAYLPFGLDVWEYLGPRQWADFQGGDLFTAWIADGLEEARHDVRPDSPWLVELNARPRNPQVSYSILLGTDGPLSADDLRKLADAWSKLCDSEPAAALLRPRVDPLLIGDEWRRGSGDGVVSLQSGRLDGVPDIVVLPFQHDSIQDGLNDAPGKLLSEAVLSRLPLTIASPEAPQITVEK